MREMSREQLESVYYAWCRAQSVREAFDQLFEKPPVESYHEIVASPYSGFLFTWIGLLYSVIEFLEKFDQIPLTIALEARSIRDPWRKFRNAVFHIKNHPLAEEYDALVELPHSLRTIRHIHNETGAYICRQLGFQFPPFVGTPAEFVVPVLIQDKPKRSTKFVCPQPVRWHEIHQKLDATWKAKGAIGEPPPIPLILNGWAFSNDYEKSDRWLATIKWAEVNNSSHLIPDLIENDQYIVEELDSTPYAGPVLGEQQHESKLTPSEADIDVALHKLRNNWNAIIGNDLANRTYPIDFSGDKKRKLIVSADPSYTPPWGSWNWFTLSGDRKSFTRFRASINQAITPLVVDHIDFIHPLQREK
jgi:hypothetical protein